MKSVKKIEAKKEYKEKLEKALELIQNHYSFSDEPLAKQKIRAANVVSSHESSGKSMKDVVVVMAMMQVVLTS